ncbi:MAG: cystatin domain-containing protein [Gemmataceae bacterium]
MKPATGIVACVIAALFASATFAQLVGGYREMPANDKETLAAAKFAVETHSKKEKVSLTKLEKAEVQVVAGRNYRLTMDVAVEGGQRKAQAVVWAKLDRSYELTDWKWKSESPQSREAAIASFRIESFLERSMRHAVVVEAVRTPIGRAHPEKGCFRDVRADDLSADIMRAAVERAGIVPSMLDDIHWGCVRQEGNAAFDVARMAALIAGFPIEVPATTAQRNCGSSLQALHQAATSIMAACDDIQLVGGVEHMHHLPLDSGYVPSPRYLQKHSPSTLHMGLTAEFLARKYGVSRREQDEFALRSHQRAGEATDRGCFADEIVPTWGRDDEGRKTLLTQDQCIRRETSLEAAGIAETGVST